MSRHRLSSKNPERRHRAVPGVEGLESRALMATSSGTFQAPDLTPLIQQAYQGVNTAPSGITTMVQALATQLTSGPLADLNSGAVTPSGFNQEVASLVSSYQANADSQLSSQFPNVDNLVKLEGTRVQADLASLVQQESVGLLTGAQLKTAAAAVISNLTSGSLQPLNTSYSAFVGATQQFESGLNTLVKTLGTGASPSLTVAQVDATLQAGADAYQADMAGSLYTNQNVAQLVTTAVTALESTSTQIAQSGASASQAQTQYQAAMTTFDDAVLGTTGVFGPKGVVGRHFSNG